MRTRLSHLLEEYSKYIATHCLGGARSLLGDFRRPKLLRCDADNPREVKLIARREQTPGIAVRTASKASNRAKNSSSPNSSGVSMRYFLIHLSLFLQCDTMGCLETNWLRPAPPPSTIGFTRRLRLGPVEKLRSLYPRED